MKQSNRLLAFFVAVLVGLSAIAVVLVLAKGQETPPQLPESDPAGVVQRYLTALQQGDYQSSLKYVAPTLNFKPGDGVDRPIPVTPDIPIPPPQGRTGGGAPWRATLQDTRIIGNTAQVDIAVNVFRPGGLFSDPVQTMTVTFFLKLIGGSWLIESPQGLWWAQ